MTIPAVVSLVTLGVRDVAAATRFYEALGFPRSSASIDGEVSFFRMAGCALGLYGAGDLHADAIPDSSTGDSAALGAFRGVSLAINVASPAEVDAALSVAAAAGATISKPAQATEWGGYHGYFADPDGHAWEVAHNPSWPLDERGLPVLPH